MSTLARVGVLLFKSPYRVAGNSAQRQPAFTPQRHTFLWDGCVLFSRIIHPVFYMTM
jgi:hypothetical protein